MSLSKSVHLLCMVSLLAPAASFGAAGGDFSPPPMEIPADYSKDALLQRGIRQSFTTQEEFEKVAQAKAEATLAARNLVPHLSINSIAALIPVIGIPSLLKAVGDLVPFLLPTRWAKKMK